MLRTRGLSPKLTSMLQALHDGQQVQIGCQGVRSHALESAWSTASLGSFQDPAAAEVTYKLMPLLLQDPDNMVLLAAMFIASAMCGGLRQT